MRFPGIARCSAAALAAFLAFGQSAWAQGCVMCYTSASALESRGNLALDKAVVVLWIPPALIFCGIFALIYRRRKTWRDSGNSAESSPDAPHSAFHAAPANRHHG